MYVSGPSGEDSERLEVEGWIVILFVDFWVGERHVVLDVVLEFIVDILDDRVEFIEISYVVVEA